jgi:hypothetical protein
LNAKNIIGIHYNNICQSDSILTVSPTFLLKV